MEAHMLTDASVSKRIIQKLSQYPWVGDSMEPTLWTADSSKELLCICQTTQQCLHHHCHHNLQLAQTYGLETD